jgi:GNAT superfamily N-acetyltransferase
MQLPVVRVATTSDIPFIVGLLYENAAILRFSLMGSLIEHSFLSAEYNDRTIAPFVERGEILVGQFGAGIGAVVYRFWEDEKFWSDRPHGEAIYLHRIEVGKFFRGLGFPEALVRYSTSEAHSTGKKMVRLNCPPRRGLQEVYERLGFLRLDEREVDLQTVVRMELRLPRG